MRYAAFLILTLPGELLFGNMVFYVEPHDIRDGLRLDSGTITTDDELLEIVEWDINVTGPGPFRFTQLNSFIPDIPGWNASNLVITSNEITIGIPRVGFAGFSIWSRDGEEHQLNYASSRGGAIVHDSIQYVAGSQGYTVLVPLSSPPGPFVIATIPEPSPIATFSLLSMLFAFARWKKTDPMTPRSPVK